MPKYRYSTDDSNRLVMTRNRNIEVATGRFSVDKENRLNFLLNDPQGWLRQSGIPSSIIFKGRWRLNQNHELELILDETKNQHKGDRLVLKGEIISVNRNELAFEIISKKPESETSFELLRLTGIWQADEFNRISFQVKKKPSPDTLTLQGNWQINRNNEITYLYEKTALATKVKSTCIITFEGFWQINSLNRIRYILENSPRSYLEFRVQCESPNLYPKTGQIKYRIGIGVRKSRKKTICLYGAWKLSRDLGLVYEMNYGKGRIYGIRFGMNLYLTGKDEFIFSLVNEQKEPLGLSITYSHKFMKKLDAQTFLRLKKIGEASSVEAGVKIPF